MKNNSIYETKQSQDDSKVHKNVNNIISKSREIDKQVKKVDRSRFDSLKSMSFLKQ